MEKPFRYLKKLMKSGNSNFVLVPFFWLAGQALKMKVKKITEVTVEVYKDKIVITPYGGK